MSSALFGSVCPGVGVSSRQAPFSSSRPPTAVHLRLGGWGRVGPCLRPSGCLQRSVPSLVSSGDQSRRDSVARADLPACPPLWRVPFRVHRSAYAQLGRAPLPTPTCDQPYVSVRTPRRLSTSVSSETSLAPKPRSRPFCTHGPVGPSNACLHAREACIPNRHVARAIATSSLSQRPGAGACEPSSLCTRSVHPSGDHAVLACTRLGRARASTAASPRTRPTRARASQPPGSSQLDRSASGAQTPILTNSTSTTRVRSAESAQARPVRR